jgi:hypothetical protein
MGEVLTLIVVAYAALLSVWVITLMAKMATAMQKTAAILEISHKAEILRVTGGWPLSDIDAHDLKTPVSAAEDPMGPANDTRSY